MSASNERNVGKADEVDVRLESAKGLAQSTINSIDNASSPSYTEEESRSVVRKLDWHVSAGKLPLTRRLETGEVSRALITCPHGQILPFIWWCYLFNSLDRNNVSNAKSDGMTGNYINTSSLRRYFPQ